MRIAMVGHKRVPSREGGIEVVVEELAARMVMHGHSVTCYNRTGHHVSGKEYDIEHLDEYRGIRLKRVPTIDRKGLAAVTSSFFGCLAAAFGPYDVVHIHAEGPAMFSWLPRLTGKRVVLTVHGLDWARDKWKGSFGSWYIHTGEKTGVRFAHEIIVLNHSTQKYFQDTYGRATRYIPNGVNPVAPAAPDIIREKYGLEKDSYILYLGRMVPEKGCHYLVDASGLLPRPPGRLGPRPCPQQQCCGRFLYEECRLLLRYPGVYPRLQHARGRAAHPSLYDARFGRTVRPRLPSHRRAQLGASGKSRSFGRGPQHGGGAEHHRGD